MVCPLRKALHGARLAPRACHQCLNAALEACGFSASSADPLYLMRGNEYTALVLI